MSSKSAVKLVVAGGPDTAVPVGRVLTGSKNALKGVRLFLGGVLLTAVRLPAGAAPARCAGRHGAGGPDDR